MVKEACRDIQHQWKLLFGMPVAGKILKCLYIQVSSVQRYECLGKKVFMDDYNGICLND
jgi:hypothetical protein